jgi:Dual-action HEIGH metallo-peptidase
MVEQRRQWFCKLLLVLAVGTGAFAQIPLQDNQADAVRALEQSTNGHLNKHAYVLLASIWLRPSPIYVCWENPSEHFQKEMQLVKQEVAMTWERESQVKFTGWQKCATENRGIRILIDDSGPHTKGLGRQLDGIQDGMVLNFTFANWSQPCQSSRDYCIKVIAGHEFGHAIGFAHEQNRPDKPGECREAAQGESGDRLLTPYDTHSIMNYCNPEWNNDGLLSALDIDGLRQIYGAPISTSGNSAPQSTLQRDQRAAAQELESSDNGHLSKHAYVLMDSVWLKPQIYVCWENPSTQFQQQMSLVREEVVSTWGRESKLQFTGWEKCAAENRGIRIQIDDSGPHTKGLGRELDGKPNGMVLNFTFANWSQSCQGKRDYCVKVIAGHEFGHAIGFAHEQNRPDVPGECQEPPQGGNGDTLLTPYDEHSIMNYCNAKWNNDGKLSKLDIDAVRKLYGIPEGSAPPQH